MNWYWPLAVVIVAALLFGYCTYATDRASRDIDRALDSFDQQACYAAGYNAAMADDPKPAVPAENQDCARWLEAGLVDGGRAYDQYEGLLD